MTRRKAGRERRRREDQAGGEKDDQANAKIARCARMRPRNPKAKSADLSRETQVVSGSAQVE